MNKRILQAIQDERDRQIVKWDVQRHMPEKWLAILMEEVGEAAKASLEYDPASYTEEMVQVAAVAIAALEDCYVELDSSPDAANLRDFA